MSENIRKLDHVSKSFANAGAGSSVTEALADINVEIRSGEFISVIGPSGCGKSTILRLIAGLIVPTTGKVTLNGEVIDGPAPVRGMVFQKPTLFPWLTVEQNVAFSLRMRGQLRGHEAEVEELMRTAGLWDFRKNWPHQLSGGMAQRAALLRTMVNNPQVFLLDEPLGALDAFTRMTMQDVILSMWSSYRPMVVMVTHDVDEAFYMGSRVIVMAPRPGRVHNDIKVDLPYPRRRTSREFMDYRKFAMEQLNFDNREA